MSAAIGAVAATVRHEPVWTKNWHLGEGLWWRNDRGVHTTILTREPEYGPKGARRSPGQMTQISGPSLAAVNRALRELGFGPSRARVRDMKWNPDPGVKDNS